MQWESLLGHLALLLKSELNLHKLLGTIVPLLPADVHSLLLLSQATLLALDWWTNLSASSSLSRSKGLLLQSYCGQMLAKQVWGGGRPVRFLGGRLVGSKPLRFHMSILELHAVLLSLQSSSVPVGFLVLVFSNFSVTFQALLKQG